MNEAILAQSCTDQGFLCLSLSFFPIFFSPPPILVADNLDTFVTDVVVTDSTDCLYDFGTLPWVVEPCCNVFLTVSSLLQSPLPLPSFPSPLSPSLSVVASPSTTTPLSFPMEMLLMFQTVVSRSVRNHIMRI